MEKKYSYHQYFFFNCPSNLQNNIKEVHIKGNNNNSANLSTTSLNSSFHDIHMTNVIVERERKDCGKKAIVLSAEEIVEKQREQ